MTDLKRHRLDGFLIAALIALVDQGVKWAVMGPLELRRVRVIDLLPFFDLRFTANIGVSLGMLPANSLEMRYLLIAFTSLIAVGVAVWMLRERTRADIAALGLVLGGAIGNIVDRLNYGFVVDYADLHFGTFRPFLIFNIADAAITIGVVIILARSFLVREKREDEGRPAPES